jgi:hypothetical protein
VTDGPGVWLVERVFGCCDVTGWEVEQVHATQEGAEAVVAEHLAAGERYREDYNSAVRALWAKHHIQPKGEITLARWSSPHTYPIPNDDLRHFLTRFPEAKTDEVTRVLRVRWVPVQT